MLLPVDSMLEMADLKREIDSMSKRLGQTQDYL